VERAGREDILARADVVSLHVRLTPETRGFIGRKELALMRPTAILVNTGRGALVDKEALLHALRERRIMGAGLDVFHQEPIAPGDPLLSLPNVVCSPHNAGQTPEVIRDGLLAAVQNVEGFLRGKPANVVVAPSR
jgi:phosphoglycerate dehydrogenase-like enzyme